MVAVERQKQNRDHMMAESLKAMESESGGEKAWILTSLNVYKLPVTCWRASFSVDGLYCFDWRNFVSCGNNMFVLSSNGWKCWTDDKCSTWNMGDKWSPVFFLVPSILFALILHKIVRNYTNSAMRLGNKNQYILKWPSILESLSFVSLFLASKFHNCMWLFVCMKIFSS